MVICCCLGYIGIRDALRNLAPFVQFKKREKHPWRSDSFSKVTYFLQLYLTYHYPHGSFSCFLNDTKGTKLCKASHAIKSFILLDVGRDSELVVTLCESVLSATIS